MQHTYEEKNIFLKFENLSHWKWELMMLTLATDSISIIFYYYPQYLLYLEYFLSVA